MTVSMRRLLAGAVLLGALATPAVAIAQNLLFWSTQATPVEESQAIRDGVLPGFGKSVTYSAQEAGPFITRIQAELQAGLAPSPCWAGCMASLPAFPTVSSISTAWCPRAPSPKAICASENLARQSRNTFPGCRRPM